MTLPPTKLTRTMTALLPLVLGCSDRSAPAASDGSVSKAADSAPASTAKVFPCTVGQPCVRTLAGGVEGHLDGPAETARFDRPWSVAVDSAGTVYVGDLDNRVIRTIKNGVVATLAGVPGVSGNQDGPSGQARFTGIQGIAVDAQGTVYVADRDLRVIRVIADGRVSTLPLAGGPTTFDPVDVAVGPGGNLHVVDIGNINCFSCATRDRPHVSRIDGDRLFPLAESYLLESDTDLTRTTLFAQPVAVSIGVDGAIYFPTIDGIRVIRGTAVEERTVNLGSDSLGTTAASDIAVDARGRVYGVSSFLQRLWWVNGESQTEIPPTESYEVGCVDGPASLARFNSPEGVAVNPEGTRIYVADTGNHRVRVVELP